MGVDSEREKMGKSYEKHRKPGRCCLSSPQRHLRPGHDLRSRSSPALLFFDNLLSSAHINMSDRRAKRMYAENSGALVPERLLVVVELIVFETMFLKGQLSKDPGPSSHWLVGHARLRLESWLTVATQFWHHRITVLPPSTIKFNPDFGNYQLAKHHGVL